MTSELFLAMIAAPMLPYALAHEGGTARTTPLQTSELRLACNHPTTTEVTGYVVVRDGEVVEEYGLGDVVWVAFNPLALPPE